ncbi:omptin family outer membrane protease [Maridesulfovibrio sp.]|uniref:omptin family outer membrane protease n=1 Tax=Maridesulfovibrio sp. TaxID=2795000 RepID=UPI0029F560AD|nr:omptin family outer membrane protease [Maridesulfovibrio sp.]
MTTNFTRITICVFAFLLCLSSTAHAFHADAFRSAKLQNESGIPASLSVEVGLLNGVARELVYIEGKGQKISELQWDLDNVMIAGVKGSFDFTDWLRFNGGFWTNFTTGDNGKVEDTDWPTPYDPRGWDSYSISNVKVKRVLITDANLEADLLKFKYLTISGMVGFKFDNYKWQDHSGSYVYSWSGFRADKGSFAEHESGLGYEQWFYTPYLGVQTESDFGDFKFKAYVKGTIYAWGEDEDYHYSRDLRFNEDIYNIKFLGAGISTSYSITEHIFSTLSFDYQKYYRQVGHTQITDRITEESSESSNSAGLDNETWNIGLELGFNF